MADLIVSADDGWHGIVATAARATAGDRIVLSSGDYAGDETIRLNSGVTLQGIPEARLLYSGSTEAIFLESVEGVVLERLHLEGYAGLPDTGPDGETDDERRVGLLRADRCTKLTVRDCDVEAAALRRGCIAIDNCIDVSLVDNRLKGARRGIGFERSSGILANNDVSGAGTHGLSIIRCSDGGGGLRIEGNRCYKNAHSGIVLFSSTGCLTANDCWDNGVAGIALARDPKSLEAPSDADVLDNRLHGNKEAGLALLSSTARIRGNECWDNGLSGMIFDRQEGTAHEPSHAEVEGNLCHHNQQSGIILFSSNGRLLDNQCCGNKSFGLVLTWDPKSPDSPSDADIEGALCHHNGESGIRIQGSTARLRDAWIWGNKESGVELISAETSPAAAAQAELVNCRAWENGFASLTVESHPAKADGLLTEKGDDDDDPLCRSLAGAGVENPSSLAAFLTSGCTKCFEAFWGRGSPSPVKSTAPHLDEEATAFDLKILGSYVIPKRRSEGKVSAILAEHVARLLRSTGSRDGEKVYWTGLVTARDVRLSTLLQAAETRIRHDGLGEAGHDSNIAHFEVDYTQQNDFGVEGQPDSAVFELECLKSPSKWRQQLVCLARSPLVLGLLLSAVGVLALGRVPRFAPAIAPIAHKIGKLAEDKGWWFWIAVVLLPLAFLSLVDLLCLPKPLRVLPQRKPQGLNEETDPSKSILDFALDVMDVAFFRHVIKLGTTLLGRPIEWLRERTWRQWVGGHLFRERRAVLCILFRGVESWRQSDIEKVCALVRRPPPGVALHLIVQMNDRSFVQPAFFDFLSKARALDCHGLGDERHISLILDDMAPEADDEADASGPSPPGLAEMIGWQTAPKDERRRLETSLRAPRWSILDLLPILALGSAPTARFHVAVPDELVSAQILANLEKELSPYRHIFEADADGADRDGLPILDKDWGMFKDHAAFAKAVQYGRTGNELLRFEGRISARPAVRSAVLQLWRGHGEGAPDSDLVGKGIRYAVAAMLCGEWRCLEDIRTLLMSGPHNALHARKLLYGFKALRYLADDRKRLAGGGLDVGAPTRWEAVRALVDGPLKPGGSPPGLATLLARAYAEHLGAFEAAAGSAAFAPHAAGVIEALAEPPRPARSIRDLFLNDMAAHGMSLRLMEPALADETLGRLRRREWSGLPESLVGAFAEACGRDRRSLTSLLADAPDFPALKALIELHRAQPIRLIYLLTALARGALAPEACVEGRTRLGVALEAVRKAAGQNALDGYSESEAYLKDLADLASRRTAPAVAAWLTETDDIADLATILAHTEPLMEIPGVIDEELDRVLSIGEKLIELYYGERKYQAMNWRGADRPQLNALEVVSGVPYPTPGNAVARAVSR